MDIDIDMSIEDHRSEVHSLMTCTKNMLLLSNLKAFMDDKKLYSILEKFGELQWCRVIPGSSGTSTRHAYAKFFAEDAAQLVIKQHDIIKVANGGQTVYIMISTIGASTRFFDAGKLYVEGIPGHITEEPLGKLFKEFGPIHSIQMVSRGCFTVHFVTEWGVRNATKSLKGKEMLDKEIIMQHYDDLPQSSMALSNQRIVLRPYNLKPDVDSQKLKEMFSFLGQVTARVEKNAYGASRGTGYVLLEKPLIDTPFFSLFSEVPLPTGGTHLEQTVGNTMKITRFGRRPFPDATYSRFYPSARPPIQRKYHRLPKNYRLYHDVDFYRSAREAEYASKFLFGYNVHVSNIGTHSRISLGKYFEKFGPVLYCTILNDANPYGIVTFLWLSDAYDATTQISTENINREHAMRAEILDSYQLPQSDEDKNFEARVNTDSEFQLGEYGVGYQMYRNFIHHVEDNGVVKRLPVSELTKIVDAKYAEIAAETLQSTDVVEQPLGEEGSDDGEDKRKPVDADAVFKKCYANAFPHKNQSAHDSSSHFVYQAPHPPYNPPHYDAPSTSSSAPPPTTIAGKQRVPDKYRDQIVERLCKFFAQKSSAERFEMLKAAVQLPLSELDVMLADDKAFRFYFIKRAVDAARKQPKK